MKTIFACAVLGIGLAACAGGVVGAVARGPLGDAGRVYVPVSRSMEVTAGELVVSERAATFRQRKGSMELAYARTLDENEVTQDSWFGGVGGPEVHLYKVVNATEYFEANKGGNGVCGMPVMWMAFSPKENGDLSLCEVTDAGGSLAPDKPTVCACGVYMPK
ncbi:MAG: hypothetical protein EON60_11380 [Alphaproteobacteria bacterium]|nr:MAG: hypothetical protein EON60_11380 [Alphaproteobacteria bacterium]